MLQARNTTLLRRSIITTMASTPPHLGQCLRSQQVLLTMAVLVVIMVTMHQHQRRQVITATTADMHQHLCQVIIVPTAAIHQHRS
jgi:hypothetical protein